MASKMGFNTDQPEKAQRVLVQWGIALAKRAKNEEGIRSKKTFQKSLSTFQQAIEMNGIEYPR